MGGLILYSAVIITALSNSFLGLFVLYRNPKNLTNQIVSLIAFLFFAWGMSLFFYAHPLIFSSFIWIKITFILVTSFIASALVFSFVFPKVIFNRFWTTALLITGLYILFSIYLLFFTDYWIVNVVTFPRLKTILGPAYIWWVGFTWLMVIMLVINFIIKSRDLTSVERAQMKFFWISFLLYAVFVNVPDVIMPLFWGNTDYFFVSSVCSVFFSGTISYTILRHRFLDIRFALQQLVNFLIMSALTSSVFIITAVSFWYLTGNPARPSVLIFIVIASFLFILILGWLQTISKFISRKFFFQSVYDYQKTLHDLSVSLSSYLEMPKLVEIVMEVLMKTMRLNRVAVLVRDFVDNHYKIQKTVGFDEENGISLVKDNFLTDYLEYHPQIIVLDEIKNLITESRSQEEENRLQELYEHMEHIEAALIVPVVNARKVIGMFVLGNKISGDAYSVLDIDLLQTVAYQASIAIENAGLYKEVVDLNMNLKHKINQATTELQKKNIDLEKAYQSLRVLDKLKDDFISIVSHELRTPMTAIRSYVWMALNKSDIPLSDKLKKYLTRTYISTERLINLVNDMLNISRIESGRVKISPQVFQIIDLVNEVVNEVAPKALEKSLSIQLDQTKIPAVFADPDKVHQVLLNLIGNAMKFTPQAGRITISFFSDGEVVEVAVKDTGVGILKEDLPKLFQKFARLDNSYVAAATSGGTGLGLFICRSLIELMGGKIWARSEGLNKGSTFSFSLPASTPQTLANADKYTNIVDGEAKALEPVGL